MDRDTISILLRDLTARTAFSLAGIRQLSAAELNAHPGGHPNSPAWLLWHTGRELDVQLTHLSGEPEVWPVFREQLGLGEIGDTLGYGHTPEQARSVRSDDQATLVSYIDHVLGAVTRHAATVDDWGEVIDTYDGEPVTRHVRLTSMLIDALEHLAQVAYIAGMHRLPD